MAADMCRAAGTGDPPVSLAAPEEKDFLQQAITWE